MTESFLKYSSDLLHRHMDTRETYRIDRNLSIYALPVELADKSEFTSCSHLPKPIGKYDIE